MQPAQTAVSLRCRSRRRGRTPPGSPRLSIRLNQPRIGPLAEFGELRLVGEARAGCTAVREHCPRRPVWRSTMVGSKNRRANGSVDVIEPVAPMEALLVDALPDVPDWQFEPKWDVSPFAGAKKWSFTPSPASRLPAIFLRSSTDCASCAASRSCWTANWPSRSATACLRLAAGAAASGREPRAQACPRDAGHLHSVRHADATERQEPDERAPDRTSSRARKHSLARSGRDTPVARRRLHYLSDHTASS